MFNNKWVIFILTIVVIFGIIIVCRLNFKGNVGSDGIGVSVDRQ